MSLELNGIITIDKLARYHEKIAAKYASTSDLENYATEEYVDEAIANIEHPIPETDNSHQYLTTNENGETVWEDKICYKWDEEVYLAVERTQTGNYYLNPMIQATANIGQNYIVTFDGVEYNIPCREEPSAFGNYLGNGFLAMDDLEDTGEPFVICCIYAGISSIALFADPSVPHTFSIRGIETQYRVIPGQYIAGGIFPGTGKYSHVFNGLESGQASGDYSAAMNQARASGLSSFAEGGSWASGMEAHAEGEGSKASGRVSHAENHYTEAKGYGAHAEGSWTIASGSMQHVQGRYNIEDTNDKYAHIVGNGQNNASTNWEPARSNAHTIDWQGNAKFAGDVYVQGTGTEDLQDAKKLATEEYVTNAISQIKIPEASANVNVYEITSDSAVLDELVALLPEGTEIHSGDVMLVTNSMGVKSAYQYDEDWIACDGNVDASKVIMPFDITPAGSYTQVGNLSKTSTGTATFATKGKSVAQAFQEMLSKREQPKIKSNPSVSLTATSGAKEVGTKITPEWSASLNAGSYTYGPATGITASSWEISDTDGNKASTASGKFAEITVGDTTNYRITAKANYAAGAIAVDNLGDPSNPTIQIAAGSKSANGSYITGYRAWFTYVGESLDAINSAFIRGTTNNGSTPATQNSVNIPAGTKRVMIAIPATSSLALKQVIDVDGMGLDVFGNFTLQTVDVEGLNGYEAKSYNVWVAENTNGMAATHYNFIIE